MVTLPNAITAPGRDWEDFKKTRSRRSSRDRAGKGQEAARSSDSTQGRTPIKRPTPEYPVDGVARWLIDGRLHEETGRVKLHE